MSVFKLKQFSILFIMTIGFVQCKELPVQKIDQVQNTKISKLREKLSDSEGKDVMVIAHRGDWRNALENSVQAIQRAADMGVDIVEIDVRLTKDSIPVLMHDSTIDRTTTGKGKVGDWTLEELKNLYLKNYLASQNG